MATYLIKAEKTITRQEGDTADIVLVVPVALDMDLYPDVIFWVVDTEGTKIMEKNSMDSDPAITVTDQTITIPITISDTTGHPGEFRWELQIGNDTPEVITIGRGDFIIVEQIITD
jgi:hypothetical protein